MFEDIPEISIDGIGINEKSYISGVVSLLKNIDQNEFQTNKPHRNLIVTGIPGSGMELFVNLLNSIDNIVYFDNSITDIKVLPQIYIKIRKSVLEDYHRPNSQYQNKKMIDEDVIVGFKQNLYYLLLNEKKGLIEGELNTLLNYGYRIIAIVRDPVYTIANWNKTESTNLPEAKITDDNLSPRWNGLSFSSPNKFIRQAQLWNDSAKLFLNLKKIIQIYTYEQITSNLEWFLNDLCNHLTLLNPQLQGNIENLNVRSKYEGIDKIKEAVDKFCPAKNEFGYTNAGAEGFVPPDLSEREKIVSSGEVDFQKIINRWKSGQPLTDN